jgi:hypothetical protein
VPVARLGVGDAGDGQHERDDEDRDHRAPPR